MKCCECKYGTRAHDIEPLTNEYSIGYCRRHAPLAALVVTTTPYMVESAKATWPVINGNDWCGDFEWRPLPLKERDE